MELDLDYGGYNCRHNYYPYFESSERSYTDQELEEINNKKVTYNNKEYSEFEAVQMQRNAERNIRATKRELAGYQAIIENSKDDLKLEAQSKFNIASLKFKKQQDELKDFINQTELTRDRIRERVANIDKNISQKAEKTNKIFSEIKEQLIGIKVNDLTVNEVSSHFIVERMPERRITIEQIKNALTNPLKFGKIRTDRSQQIIGEFATVAINVDTGKLTTVWQTGVKKAKKLKERSN